MLNRESRHSNDNRVWRSEIRFGNYDLASVGQEVHIEMFAIFARWVKLERKVVQIPARKPRCAVKGLSVVLINLCCIKDDSRSIGVAEQAEASNHFTML